jgi:hypothetical protein
MRQKQSDIATHPPPSIKLDVERYDHLLNNTSLTPDQRREFLEAMWNLIVGFVDLGFQVEPLDEGCEQVAISAPKRGEKSNKLLCSNDKSQAGNLMTTNFNFEVCLEKEGD